MRGVHVLARIGSVWFVEPKPMPDEVLRDDFPLDLPVEAVAGAPGYVPRRVSMSDCTWEGGERVLRVPLRRGHGAAIVVLDAEANAGFEWGGGSDALIARAVPGARVVVAGQAAGSPDPDGLVIVEDPAPIRAFRVEAPGWVTLDVRGFHDHASTPVGLGFALMLRE